MTKQTIFVVTAAGVTVLLAWGLWAHFKPSASISVSPLPSVQQPGSPLHSSLPTANQSAGQPSPTTIQTARAAEKKREQTIWSAWIATPIVFYGKVVDEQGAPIDGAKAIISSSDEHIFQEGGGINHELVSDANGKFSISGIHGMGIGVDVSKKGYYHIPQSYGSFGYVKAAGGSPPHTDPNDPAIFVFKKMGQTEPLIVFNGKQVPMERDGTPAQINLHTGKSYRVSNGDLQIETWAHDKDPEMTAQSHYAWRCRISVPGGGLVQGSGGDFDFEAPLGGYQEEDVIDMPANANPWNDGAQRTYFLKLASGEYARINLRVAAGGYNFFTVTSYLNPQPGHRNLE